MTGHVDLSNPQGALNDYRQGRRHVYKGGELCEVIDR